MADSTSDAVGSVPSAALGLALADYLTKAQQNANAKRQNAAISKWAPLLALNGSKGAAMQQVPSASLSGSFGPAIASILAAQKKQTAPPDPNQLSTGTVNQISGMPGSSNPLVDPNATGAAAVPPPSALTGGQGEMGGGMGGAGAAEAAAPAYANSLAGAGDAAATAGSSDATLAELADLLPVAEDAAVMAAAGGGMVPRYAEGGAIGPQISKGFNGAMGIPGITKPWQGTPPQPPPPPPKYGTGGFIPGQEVVPGNSYANDTKTIQASPGEVMLPKDVAQAGMNGNKWKVAAYLHEVKKHGPGPLPPNRSANAKPPGKSSMSPWTAMACGGKV